MIQKLVYTIAFCTSQFLFSQEISEVLKNIQIPNTPALALLDNTATIVENPTSTKAFATNIFSSIKSNGGFPDNYAFEITPFWLIERSNMNSLRYAGYDNKKDKQLIFTNIQKSSISFGYEKKDANEETMEQKTSTFSVGLRSNIIRVRKKSTMESIKQMDSEIFKDLSDDIKLWEEYVLKNNIKNDEDYVNKYKNFIVNILPEIKTVKKFNYKELLESPPALSVDFATAYSTFYLNDSFAQNYFGRYGVWMSLNSGFDLNDSFENRKAENKDKKTIKKVLNLYAIARYIEDRTQFIENNFETTKSFDVGGKIELIYDRFSISYEYLNRENNIEKTYRSNGVIGFRVSNDVFITGAFGKNFGEKDNLISLLGIKWGIGSNETIKDNDSKK